MMTGFDGTLLWCVGQVSLLAAMGGLAAMLLTRRAPWAAASASIAAVAAIVAVTVLAPVELPAFAAMEPAVESRPDVAPAKDRPALSQSSERSGNAGDGVSIVPLLKELSRALSQAAEAAPQRAPRTFEVSFWMGVVAVAAGVLRLAFAFAWVWKLRRGSSLVEDAQVLGVFDELRSRLNLKRMPGLRETSAIASPAVIGWRRRMVLLPANRFGWDERQLRATLAHELAHVVRGDFEWRLAASVVRAVHFFNPLAHWLARRLALAQELAADRMAAAATGGSLQYASALASLALNLDRSQRMRSDAIALPVFSQNLSRRLTMLRSTDGSMNGGKRSLVGMAAGCAIVFAAVMTTALRSRADAAKVAERELFGQKGPDVSFMGPVDVGMMVIRPNEITKIDEFALATSMAEGLLKGQVDAMALQGVEGSPLRFAAIDYIAYSLRGVTAKEMATAPVGDADPDELAGLMCECAIRWVAASEMAKWEAAWQPLIEGVDENGFRYARLKIGDEIDSVYYIAQRDPHTTVMSYSKERLRKLVQEDGLKESTSWEALAGGLVRCQLNLKALPAGVDFDDLLMDSPLSMFLAGSVGAGEVNPLDEARSMVAQATDVVCVGLDFNPAAQQVDCRIAFSTKDVATAEQVSSSVQVFQAVWKAMSVMYQKESAAHAEELQALDDESRSLSEGVMAGMRMLAEAKFDVRARGAAGADAWMEMTGELPSSVRAYLTGGGSAGNEGYRGNGATSGAARPIPASEAATTTNEIGAGSRELFTRPEDTSMLLGSSEQGAFVVRVGELVRVPAFAQALPLLNSMIHEQLKQQVNVALQDIPEVHLEAIEWIAGVPGAKIKPKKGPEKGQEGLLMFSCKGFMVRFREKVDWKSWLVEALPATKEHESVRGEKFNYMELPPIPGDTAFGSDQFLVAARDERTLVVSTDVDELRKLAQSDGAEAKAAIGAKWKSLDGGLATVIAKIDAAESLVLPEELGPRLMISILEKCSEFGLAFDINPATRAAQFRMTLAAADQATAEEVKKALEELLPLFAKSIDEELENPTKLVVDPDDPYREVQTLGDDDTNREVAEFWRAILQSCQPQIVAGADGGLQVQLTASATLPEQMMVAYEYVAKDEAAEKDAAERR